MKLKSLIAALTGPLLYANGCGSLLPVFADNAAPASEVKTVSATDGTNGTERVLAPGSDNHIRLLAAALHCQQMNLEVIANNMANVNTTGFKACRMRFQDMSRDGNGQTTLLKGAEPGRIQRLFTQGELWRTGEKFDLAIQGEGFFAVLLPDGTMAFTRDGGFRPDAHGCIVTSEGYPVQGNFLTVPAGVTAVAITEGGQLSYSIASGTVMTCQVQLARFINPSGLDALGHNLFRETEASGHAEFGNAGENGFGELQQGCLELSNVSLVHEMANRIITQRACDAIEQSLQAADKSTPSNLQAKQ